MVANRRRVSAGRKILAGLALALWTMMSTVAVSPGLHQWLHADSQNGSHDCVFTQVSKGQIVGASAGLVIGVVGFFLVRVVLASEPRLVPAALYRWSPSRAPPRFFLPPPL